MAEITAAAAGSKPGGRRGKKLSTRVDLTPMVDLGFILITFFIFTTTMSEPSAMKLVMPAEGAEMPVGESGTLTLVPFKDDRVFYYHGILHEALQAGRYGTVGYLYPDGIGQVIRAKQEAMERQEPMSKQPMMVIVKPVSTASYSNVVDILDEMTINGVKRYALTELSIDEKATLAEKNIR